MRSGADGLQPCCERSCPLSWLEIPVLWASFLISAVFLLSLPPLGLSKNSLFACHCNVSSMALACTWRKAATYWRKLIICMLFPCDARPFFSPSTAVLFPLCAVPGSQATTIPTSTRSTRGLKIWLDWRWTRQRSCRWTAALAHSSLLQKLSLWYNSAIILSLCFGDVWKQPCIPLFL